MKKIRKIIATVPANKFKPGQQVIIDGDCAGNYYGEVVEAHAKLTIENYYGKPITAPGITVRVVRWDGQDYKHSENFQIVAHDSQVINQAI